MRSNKLLLAGVMAWAFAYAGQVVAEDHIVLAVGPKFAPLIVKIQPGDTVVWKNMLGHDAVSVPGMIPEGAKDWKSLMGEDIAVTFDKPGAYVYICTPHLGAGMAGAIIVGDGEPVNLTAIEAHPEMENNMVRRIVKKMKKVLAKSKALANSK